jgi:quercetin dioxygenase-like cupin family protein
MNRKNFLSSSAAGIGALSLAALVSSCTGEPISIASKSNSKATADESVKVDPKIVKSNQGTLLNVMGDKQNIKLTGSDTNEQFTLIEQFNDPGIGIPPHVHENEDEVFQVLEGEVEMSIGNEATMMKAGDIIFCPKGIPHSWKVVGDQKAKAMLSIFPAGLEHMFTELSLLPAGPPDFEKVAAICGNFGVRFV